MSLNITASSTSTWKKFGSMTDQHLLEGHAPLGVVVDLHVPMQRFEPVFNRPHPYLTYNGLNENLPKIIAEVTVKRLIEICFFHPSYSQVDDAAIYHYIEHNCPKTQQLFEDLGHPSEVYEHIELIMNRLTEVVDQTLRAAFRGYGITACDGNYVFDHWVSHSAAYFYDARQVDKMPTS